MEDREGQGPQAPGGHREPHGPLRGVPGRPLPGSRRWGPRTLRRPIPHPGRVGAATSTPNPAPLRKLFHLEGLRRDACLGLFFDHCNPSSIDRWGQGIERAGRGAESADLDPAPQIPHRIAAKDQARRLDRGDQPRDEDGEQQQGQQNVPSPGLGWDGDERTSISYLPSN